MRIRTLNVVMLAVGLVAVLASDAEAQRRRGLVDVSPADGRRGFWLDGGLGWGEESFKFGNEPWSEGLAKPTFNLRLGGTPNPNLRLGGEVTVWANRYQDLDGENLTETLSSVLAVARVFPSRTTGFYLKGGAGLGVSAVDVDFGQGTSETGLATTLGAGWEIKLSRALSLTPEVAWYRHSYTKRDDDTLHERLANVSLAITWQPGR